MSVFVNCVIVSILESDTALPYTEVVLLKLIEIVIFTSANSTISLIVVGVIRIIIDEVSSLGVKLGRPVN